MGEYPTLLQLTALESVAGVFPVYLGIAAKMLNQA